MLQDQKIRHYKIEDRAPLRDVKASDWNKERSEGNQSPNSTTILLVREVVVFEVDCNANLVQFPPNKLKCFCWIEWKDGFAWLIAWFLVVFVVCLLYDWIAVIFSS